MPYTFFDNPNKELAHLQFEAKRLYDVLTNLVLEKVNHLKTIEYELDPQSYMLTFSFEKSFKCAVTQLQERVNEIKSGRFRMILGQFQEKTNNKLFKKYEGEARKLDKIFPKLSTQMQQELLDNGIYVEQRISGKACP